MKEFRAYKSYYSSGFALDGSKKGYSHCGIRSRLAVHKTFFKIKPDNSNSWRWNMGRYFGLVVVALLTGIVSAIIAKKKGRDAVAWFLAGIFFNLFALAAVAFLKNLKEKRGLKNG